MVRSEWGRQQRQPTRPQNPSELKKDFEKSLTEINKRQGNKAANKAEAAAVASSSPTAAAPAAAAPPPPAQAASSRFTFNRNANTFTPGAPAAPAAAAPPALNIAITPGGSLSGTLKGSGFGEFAQSSVPAFEPLCDAASLQKISISESLVSFAEHGNTKSPEIEETGSSYKDVLGPMTQGMVPPYMMFPPPPPMMMYPPQFFYPPHGMRMPPPFPHGGFPEPRPYYSGGRPGRFYHQPE